MTRSQTVKLGLLLFGLLYLGTIGFNWKDIETDIANRTSEVLKTAGMDWAQVELENRGRDLLLTGTAPSESARDEAIRIAQEVWGVRAVDSEIRLLVGNTEAQVPARLRVSRSGDQFIVSGSLPDGGEKAQLLEYIKDEFDAKAESNLLQIGTNVEPAPWLDNLQELLEELEDVEIFRLSVQGKRLVMDGSVESDEIEDIMEEARDLFDSDWSIENRMTLIEVAQLSPDSNTPLDADVCQIYLNTLAAGTTINFAVGSAVIQTDNLGQIAGIGTVARACKQSRIRVEGHTDNTGDPELNRRLSKARAQAVLALLVQSGVDQQRLEAVGYGADRPIESNDTDAGRAKNRRIEFRILLN